MECKITLPHIYSEEVWKRNGARPEHRDSIGKFFSSWSQIESFQAKKGFNTSLSGRIEYMKRYFFKQKFPDMGWGQHGTEVEAYVCYNDAPKEVIEALDDRDKAAFYGCQDRLSPEELNFLKGIEPLGEFQREITYRVPGLPVVVMGFIDDMTTPTGNVIKMIRDYKCKSTSSAKDLQKKDVYQLDIYAESLKQDGYVVEAAEYKVIYRVFNGIEARAFMASGGGVEYLACDGKEETFPYTRFKEEKRVKEMESVISQTVTDISKLYVTFTKYFKNDKN